MSALWPYVPTPGQAESASNLRRVLATARSWRATATAARSRTRTRCDACRRCTGDSRCAPLGERGHRARAQQRDRQSLIFHPDATHPEADLISGGNFHGQPLALALDWPASRSPSLPTSASAGSSNSWNPALSSGLTPFLGQTSGLDSGFMIAQVASASLVSENKVLAHPASVDSIPSSAGKEDHVSMGSGKCRKLGQIALMSRRLGNRDPYRFVRARSTPSPLAGPRGPSGIPGSPRGGSRDEGRPPPLPRYRERLGAAPDSKADGIRRKRDRQIGVEE